MAVMSARVAANFILSMDYKFEHIELETPDDEQIEDLARLFASIIYEQMVKENEQESDLV